MPYVTSHNLHPIIYICETTARQLHLRSSTTIQQHFYNNGAQVRYADGGYVRRLLRATSHSRGNTGHSHSGQVLSGHPFETTRKFRFTARRQAYPHAHKHIMVFPTGRSVTAVILPKKAASTAMYVVYPTPPGARPSDTDLNNDDLLICFKQQCVRDRFMPSQRLLSYIDYCQAGPGQPCVFTSYATDCDVEAHAAAKLIAGDVDGVFSEIALDDESFQLICWLRLLRLAWYFGSAMVSAMLQRRTKYLSMLPLVGRQADPVTRNEMRIILLAEILATASVLDETQYIDLYIELSGYLEPQARLYMRSPLVFATQSNRVDITRFVLAMATDPSLLPKAALDACILWAVGNVKTEMEAYRKLHHGTADNGGGMFEGL